MLKISSKLSVRISLTLTAVFLAALAVGAVAMPWIAYSMMHMPQDKVGETLVFLLVYAILAAGGVAGVLMLRLLRLVQKGQVFTVTSISSLRGVSWCCVLAGFLFALLGWYFPLSLAVGFVAVFVGLCLRVMKNVLEEATAIKSENDLTV